MPSLNELRRLADDALIEAQDGIKAGESLIELRLAADAKTMMFLLGKIDQLISRTMELNVGVALIKMIQMTNGDIEGYRDKVQAACAALESKR